MPRWLHLVCTVVGSSVRVEHPSEDRIELGGGGGIHNHNGQHVSYLIASVFNWFHSADRMS